MYIEEGMPNDQETQVFFDGTRYLGQFKDGAAHGRGTITFSDGSIYTGQFENGEISGQGTMVFPDGSEYVGQFKDGMIHGQGSITFSDGSIYEGPFVDNKYHGEGVWSSPYGITYSGQFKAGKFDGQGMYTLPDGSRYVGRFKDDHFHGGTWDQGQQTDSRFENASSALGKKEHEVETKSMEGFVPSQAYPDTSVLDTAGRCEETQPAGDGLSFQTASGPAFSVQVGGICITQQCRKTGSHAEGKGISGPHFAHDRLLRAILVLRKAG